MDRVATRLRNCFHIVFPDLSVQRISGATRSSVAAWDSIASITLMNVIGDEFGIEVDFDRLGELDSFERICQCLHEAGDAAVQSDGPST